MLYRSKTERVLWLVSFIATRSGIYCGGGADVDPLVRP
jgi:hypothetical protein